MGDEYGYAPSAAKSGPSGQPDEREARGLGNLLSIGRRRYAKRR
jgi:hypothetical protein